MRNIRNLLASLIVVIFLAVHVAALNRCFAETNKSTVTPTPTSFDQFKNTATVPSSSSPIIVLKTLRICFDAVTCAASGEKPIAFINMIWSDGTYTSNQGSGFTDTADDNCQQIVFDAPAQVTAIDAWTSAACHDYITRFDFTVNSNGAIST